MFFYKSEKLSNENIDKLLRKAFTTESSDGKRLFKTDFKCVWLYLFGYKISKVNYSLHKTQELIIRSLSDWLGLKWLVLG